MSNSNQAFKPNTVQGGWLGNVNTALRRSEQAFWEELRRRSPASLCDTEQDLLKATLQH